MIQDKVCPFISSAAEKKHCITEECMFFEFCAKKCKIADIADSLESINCMLEGIPSK